MPTQRERIRLRALTVAVVLSLGLLRAPNVAHAGEPAPLSDTELPKKLDEGIARTFKALLAKQTAGGGWHSETYGPLKPGAATTAFVLEALSRLPEDERKAHTAAFAKAMKFLHEATDQDGAIGMKGEWPEYPTYATALAITTWARLKPEGWEKTIKPWVQWLKSAQHSEDNGCKLEDPAYGGWNPLGRYREGRPRHAELSATRYALQALQAAGGDRQNIHEACRYVLRCHNLDLSVPMTPVGDAGFSFTTTSDELNKAGQFEKAGKKKGRSYGSATADGVICLEILNLKDEGITLHHALDWLWKHAKLDRVYGIPENDPQRKNWDKAMLFYYRAALAEVYEKAPQKAERHWVRNLAHITLTAQRDDGLFANDIPLMKEDDPLVATPFALRTLLFCREFLNK